MSSGRSGCSPLQEALGVDVNSSVQELIDGDHVTSASPIVERREFEHMKPLGVGPIPESWDKLGHAPLNPLHKLFICSVEWAPNCVGILKMRSDQHLEQERQCRLVDVLEQPPYHAEDLRGLGHR